MTLPAPKHYWNFNEASGTTAADSTGGAVMALDRPGWVPGRLGNAVRFNPKDGVRLATTSLPDMRPPWTAAVWVKREADTEGAALWSSDSHAIKLEQWRNTHQVGITEFTVFDKTFDAATPLNQWAQLVLVGTATETRLYVSGQLRGTLPVSIGLGLRWLGSTQGYEEFASALLDEVKIFDVALTDAQVAELAGGENLIKNGTFEQGIALSASFTTLTAGSQAITDWTVTRGTVDYVPSQYWQPAEGSRSVDLSGADAGGISQAFATMPGAVYRVTFALAANPEGGPVEKVMRVAVGPSASPPSADFRCSNAGRSVTNMGWERHSWEFTAQATSTTLEFYSLTDGSYGPVLDDVCVQMV